MFRGMWGGPRLWRMLGMRWMHGGCGYGHRWHDVPTRDEVIAELERYQRDLEEETAAVAGRINELRRASGTSAGQRAHSPSSPETTTA